LRPWARPASAKDEALAGLKSRHVLSVPFCWNILSAVMVETIVGGEPKEPLLDAYSRLMDNLGRDAAVLLNWKPSARKAICSNALLASRQMLCRRSSRSSHRWPPRRDASLRCGWLLYSAFAETFRTFQRIDLAARLRWLLDLREPRAITGRANNFGQNFTRLFHSDQSLKQNQELN
jgi:hypothetical protein